MPTRTFAVTFDYRCPFARIAADHVVAGLRAGAPWTVTWIPFSLSQVHVEDGDVPVWDRPDIDSGLLALQVAAAVQATAPERYADVHRDLFDVRHVHARSLRDPDALAEVMAAHDVDPEAVWTLIAEGGPLDSVRKAHEGAVASHDVWGVPTFLVDDQATFVRLMRPSTDGDDATRTVDRVLDMVAGRARHGLGMARARRVQAHPTRPLSKRPTLPPHA
jgi:2-hydroxychromene-2-carboxylate isomerase